MSKSEERLMEKSYSIGYNNGYEKARHDLGWISVKDRLPEKDGFYLTCVNQAGVAQCVGLQYFATNLMKWRDFDEEVREVFIDYWMEIPKLPKEEGQ